MHAGGGEGGGRGEGRGVGGEGCSQLNRTYAQNLKTEGMIVNGTQIDVKERNCK